MSCKSWRMRLRVFLSCFVQYSKSSHASSCQILFIVCLMHRSFSLIKVLNGLFQPCHIFFGIERVNTHFKGNALLSASLLFSAPFFQKRLTTLTVSYPKTLYVLKDCLFQMMEQIHNQIMHPYNCYSRISIRLNK